MSVRVRATDMRVLPMHTRMPFRYGIATLTALPHLFVRVEAEIDGATCVGVASDGLAPKWFTKNPATSAEYDITEMLRVITAACAFAREAGVASTVFELWQRIYDAQQAWAGAQHFPPLLAGFGVSLVERALIDAFCRARGRSFATAVREHSLGIRLDALHPELAGAQPVDLLPLEPLSALTLRHTIGLSDPLTNDQIAPAEHVDDGLPQSLVACIRVYGLTHFKIKIRGELAGDLARLRQIAAILAVETPNYAFTLDGNEQFHAVATFRELWQALQRDPELAPLMRRLLFVEQPLHRDLALSAATARALLDWPDRPPIIIDESDGELASLPTALAAGYAGTSHKNCKGVFKGIANAALIAHRQRIDPARNYILSGEDLSNVGPVALLQDLAVMATLGVGHVERNGQHYFTGLSMYAPELQERVLEHHGDLYHRHPRGFATLNVQGGRINIGSVVAAPFGLAFPFNTSQYMSLEQAALA
ncbi:MAG: hypothetical protein ABIV47_24780 [Roseiflexaceae bacterium]